MSTPTTNSATMLTRETIDAPRGVVGVAAPVRNARKLARWRAARGRARFEQQSVPVIGDSLTDGYNANGKTIETDADKSLARARGYVSQTRDLIAANLGIHPGEGFAWMGQTPTGGLSVDARWTYATNGNPTAAAGAFGQGRRLVAGNHATALAQRCSVVDVLGWTGGSSSHLPGLEIDDQNARPTRLAADAKAGVVAAGKWQPRGSGTTVAADGAGGLTVTRTGTDLSVVIDYGTNLPCTAGEWLAGTMVQTKAGTARNAVMQLTFYDATGTIIGVETNLYTAVSSGAGTPTQATGLIQVPVGATQFRVAMRGVNWVQNEVATFSAFDVVPIQRVGVTDSTGSYFSYRSSTVAIGSHKVRIVAPASGQSDVSGIVLRDRVDAGILVHRVGRPGATTATVTGTDTEVGATPTLVDQRLAAITKLFATIAPTPLLVMTLGTNNPSNGVSVAAYRAHLKQMTDYQSAQGGCTLLVAGPRFDGATSGSANDLEPYYAAAADLSDVEQHVAFLDLKDSWGDYSNAYAAGLALIGTIHPGLAGHGDWAVILADALLYKAVTAA